MLPLHGSRASTAMRIPEPDTLQRLCDERGRPRFLWDLDLTIVQEKVGTGTAVRIVKFAPAMEVNPTNKEPLPAALFQPMEFNDFWSHMSLEDQAKNLGRPNVFGEEEQKMLDDFFAAPPTPQAAPSEPDKNSIPWGRK